MNPIEPKKVFDFELSNHTILHLEYYDSIEVTQMLGSENWSEHADQAGIASLKLYKNDQGQLLEVFNWEGLRYAFKLNSEEDYSLFEKRVVAFTSKDKKYISPFLLVERPEVQFYLDIEGIQPLSNDDSGNELFLLPNGKVFKVDTYHSCGELYGSSKEFILIEGEMSGAPPP